MTDREKLSIIRDPLILCGAFLIAVAVAPQVWMMVLFGAGALMMAVCAQMGWRIAATNPNNPTRQDSRPDDQEDKRLGKG